MYEMQAFTNEQFGQVRIVMIEGILCFVASDVCKALEITNPSMALVRLDDDEKMTLNLTDSHSGKRGGAQKMIVVNEPGLYSLVIGSRKPEARQFKRWITHDVIPSIRKHGAYMTDDVLEHLADRPEAIYELAERLVQERNRKRELEQELGTAKPKLDYYDTYINPMDCTNIRNTAKELDIPQNKFVQLLLSHRIMYHDPTHRHLLPYRKYQVKGYFIVRDVYTQSGMLVQQSRFTCKGKDYLRKKIREWKGEK